eukprot:198110-Pleurochrysis_carterae.AAC.3
MRTLRLQLRPRSKFFRRCCGTRESKRACNVGARRGPHPLSGARSASSQRGAIGAGVESVIVPKLPHPRST